MLIESLKVVSVTTRSVQQITIGGEQGGLRLADAVNEPWAWPLLTLKTPDADTDSLFAAFGCFEPGLMHSAVPERVIVTEFMLLPSPASLNATVIVLEVTLVTLAKRKWGLVAKASETARTSISIASNVAITNRRMVVLLSKYNATQSKSAHMHTTGYSNMEALQATKALAHYENTVEKHALRSVNTTTRPIAQQEVVQNRQRESYPGMGEYT